ncbi:NACHT domain-containing protein [Streptomyces sp. NPDC001212]|uniref:NACHT domain-containing protein n=1 Tax=Streptomyces sp. NPDC001698 TaxID=3364601 RepID=UPI00369C1779
MENADSLASLFENDELASKALVDWAHKVHRGLVRPHVPRWRPLGQGASGAGLTAVVASRGPGVMVVKVSPHGQGGEGHPHAEARKTAQNHVPTLHGSWPVEDGRVLTFQSPATGSLDDLCAMASLGNDLPAGCAYLTRWLLTEWNNGPGGGTSDHLPVGELLRQELGALVSRGGSALAYGSRLGGLEADTPWIKINGLDLPNPLALAQADAGHPKLDVMRGRAHGDLHLHNVLVPVREGRARFEKFQLIDLATFSQNAPLSRDVATLLLSAVEPTVREQPTEEGDALLHYLVRPHEDSLRQIKPATKDIVQTVRDTCEEIFAGGLYDLWHRQFLLSLIVTGLQGSTYENMGDGGRWWCFRLAARAGGELLQRLGTPIPPGVTITGPEPAGRYVTCGTAVPPERWTGAAAAADRAVRAASVSRGATTDRSEELRELEAYSHTAVAAAGHQGASGMQAQPLDLTALAVPRDLERDLLKLLGMRQPICVVGDPGSGKTTLLWRLHHELSADPLGPRPYFLRAGDLRNTASGAGLALETLRAACRSMTDPAVFLFDTADLLVSDATGFHVLQELLTIAADNSVRVLMTCRKEEWNVLQSQVEDFGVQQRVLGPYSPREQEAAIRSHARYFYEGEAEVSVDKVCRDIANAAVQGLPMRKVCEAPLTLRMLFETFAPQPPQVQDIDTAILYDRYWSHRVSQDQRAGDAPATGTGPLPDLTGAGEELAQLMLGEGRLDILGAEVLADRSPSGGPGLERGLQGLVARGVVERQGAGTTERYTYFHQTLFEYAAGRRLSRTAASDDPSLLGELLGWLKDHPEDQFRLAVAEQALIQAGRGRNQAAEACTALLTGTLADTWDAGTADTHPLRAMQLRVYARLPQPDAALRCHFTSLIATLDPDLARVYLETLPTTLHKDGDRIVDELLALWRSDSEELRQPVLIALKWFAETLPKSVITVFDRSCPSNATRGVACKGPHCDPRSCVWAWLLTLHNSEMHKFLGVLEALALENPGWVWHRLRMVVTDPRRDLLTVARCLRLVARPLEWPERERPFSAVRHIVRHRWGHGTRFNNSDVQVQAALGQLIAGNWLSSGRQPPLDSVLRAAARHPKEFTSYVQVHAVARMARQASTEEVGHLLDVLEEVTAPTSLTLLSTCLLLPLLTATRAPDTLGGDTPPSRARGPEPAATQAVRSWLALRLRTRDRAAPADATHQLAAETWKRSLDVATTARLVGEAWPEGAAGQQPDSGGSCGAEAELHRIWLTDPDVAILLVAAAAAGQAQARTALRLWRTERAGKGHVTGPGRGTGVTQTDKKISNSLQALVAEHPELLDELFAGGAVDPRLDPAWLNAALPQAGTDIDRRLAAALRRHRTALEEVCDLAVTREYGADNARTALHVRGRLIALGVLGPPAPARLREMLGRRGHPRHVGAALQLVETVVEHSPNGSLNTPEWQQLEEEDLRHFAAADYVEGRTGQGERELVQAAARRCMTGLLCRHHPLTTQAQVGRARNGALRHLATATQVGDVTVLGRLLERLADAAPQEAVTLVNAAARKLRTLSTGKVTTLAQRWQRPLSRLAERASPEQWRELVEGVWDGPVELLRVLIRSGIRHRTDDTARYLLSIADSNPWPGVVRETVRIGTLLRSEGSPQRWLPALETPSSAQK